MKDLICSIWRSSKDKEHISTKNEKQTYLESKFENNLDISVSCEASKNNYLETNFNY